MMFPEGNFSAALITSVLAVVIYLFFLWYIKRTFSDNSVIRQARCATKYGNELYESNGFINCTTLHTREGHSSTFFDVDQWFVIRENRISATLWLTKEIFRIKNKAHQNNITIDGIVFIDQDSGPTGLLSLQYVLADSTHMKTCVIRLHRWPFMPQAAIKGHLPKKGSHWILVSDVVTTGGHIKKAAQVLRHDCWQANIPFAVVLLDRSQSVATDILAKSNIELSSWGQIAALFDEQLKRAAGKKLAA